MGTSHFVRLLSLGVSDRRVSLVLNPLPASSARPPSLQLPLCRRSFTQSWVADDGFTCFVLQTNLLCWRAMAGWLVSSILSITRLVTTIRKTPSTSTDPRNDIEQDLSRLVRALERIQAVLHDAEEREIRDESVKLWLRELRGVAYEAEDVLDDYHYELLRSEAAGRDAAAMATHKRKRVDEGDVDQHQKVCDLVSTSSSSSKVSIPDGMVNKIKEIRMRFDEIARDRDALHLRSEDGERRFEPPAFPPPSGPLVDDLGVFGREDDKKKLMELLFSDEGCRFSVIPIVGMGGLGKTTLAQLVYNDPKICMHFELRGWVSVSVDFDLIRLMRAIIESISNVPCGLTELSSLQNTLRMEVKNKFLLLVLDDIWNENRNLWESLKVALLCGKWVRVIVTTRNTTVAEIMQTVPPYFLTGLPEEQCGLLFQRHAFGFGSENIEAHEKQLVEIGEKIVNKCAGLPLAVKALGCLLRGETDRERWEEVLESDIWELGQWEGGDEILPALRLSYHQLPTSLKPCFVYCSMFPKSYRFKKDKLIRLWMAQRYIQPRGNRSLEDLGSEYFDQLVRRSFFQMSSNARGKERFVIHDLMVDLARSISGGDWCGQTRSNAQHLFVENGIKAHEIIENLQSYYHKPTALRTFFVPPRQYDPQISSLGPLMKLLNLRYLRALSWIRIEWLPYSIGSMKHLRYLGLEYTSADVLPESIHQLYNLQTLVLKTYHSLGDLSGSIGRSVNLRYISIRNMSQIKYLPGSLCQLYNLRTLDLEKCSELKLLPSGIGDLINLRHLFLPYGLRQAHAPIGIGRLTNLRSISYFDVEKFADIKELKGLVELRGNIQILGLENVASAADARKADLKGKQHIEKLCLFWFSSGGKVDEELEAAVLEGLRPHNNLKELMIRYYRGARFPSWMGDPSFSKLTSVKLSLRGNKSLVCLPPLGQLPSLKFLYLSCLDGVRFIGHEFSCCGQEVGFPSLQRLEFRYMVEWEKWDGVLDGDYPQLKFLRIEHCSKLKWLPALPLLQSSTLEIIACDSLSTFNLQQNSGRPSRLQELQITGCWSLTSVMGLHTIDSLEKLKIIICPVLRIWPEELPSKLQEFKMNRDFTATIISRRAQSQPDVEIIYRSRLQPDVETIYRSRLQEWCQMHNFTYSVFEDTSMGFRGSPPKRRACSARGQL